MAIKKSKKLLENEKPIALEAEGNEDLIKLYSDDGLHVSEEEYWDKYYHEDDFVYEWNNGILEVKPMADYESSETYRWFIRILEEYLTVNPIAKPVYLEIGFRLDLGTKVTIRKPDLALILNSNPISIDKNDNTYKGIYDICIEFLSDSKKSEIERDTVKKKSEYCLGGVKEYYILDRKKTETAFYYLGRNGIFLPIEKEQGVIKSKHLPGFQFYIEDLYSQPNLQELIYDKVYNSFILKELQDSLAKVKEESKQRKLAEEIARKESIRAEQQAARADRLAAKLRELGINPKSI